MPILTFGELQAELRKLYQEGDYTAALKLANREAGRFPEFAPLLYYWRMAMSARTGHNDQAIDLLIEALDAGLWFSEVLLRRTPSFEALQADAEFEELMEVNRHLQRTDEALSFPLLTLRTQGQCQGESPPCPLMLALHANASTAVASVEFWRPAATAGWLVAVPQSKQALWKGAFVWDDPEVAEEEIKKHFTSLIENYTVDRQRVILAGHSMGGEVALRLALTGAIEAQGFIAIGPNGPWLNEPQRWGEVVREHHNYRLRGYLIAGEEDEAVSHSNIQALTELLNQEGIPCELEEVPHAGHEYAPEFESSLLRGLEFIDTK